MQHNWRGAHPLLFPKTVTAKGRRPTRVLCYGRNCEVLLTFNEAKAQSSRCRVHLAEYARQQSRLYGGQL